ncbi:CLUMA_CG009795, isoform A [Clunio marinus]|uniref:CLUMA_CG009795, isoform A n=1 Tax=Clunio marinus TaxID=568069 RepID=A0A1J1I9G6_9DIPT|nr:CLUMA_CG009795, isoform A [Clunio marinus]
MNSKNLSLLVVFISCFLFCVGEECGTIKYSSELIFGGQYAKRGQWPWLCTLHDSTSDEFFCGSTLISSQHVLTAAHCFWSKGNFAPSHDATNSYIAAGKYDLRYFENTEQKRKLVEVVIHPDWKYNTENFDADIAVATMEYPVQFTTTVQPICLPNFNSVLIHPMGTVVGWGKSETSGPSQNDHESIPKQVGVRAVTNEECFLHYIEFAKISSPRTFCAGWPGQNVGPCHGDSGGGFYYKVGNVWYIQGIVSATVIDGGRCDVSKYSVYTNVLKLADWIKDQMRTKVYVSWTDIPLNCVFIRNYDGLYGCEVENIVIDSPNYRIANILGTHTSGQTNLEVEYVWIKNSRAANNSLEVLEANFFKNNHVLKIVTLDNNKLTKIGFNLIGYKNVQKIDLLNNTCIDINFNNWRKKNSVAIVQAAIDRGCR